MPPEAATQTLILEARTRSGWVGERPWPTESQLDELMTLVGDRVPLTRVPCTRRFMSHIFVTAVEDTVRLFWLRTETVKHLGVKRGSPKLTTVLAKEREALVAVERSGVALNPMTEGLRRALATAQFLKRELPSPSSAAREVDAIVDAALGSGTITPQLRQLLHDLTIVAKRGRDWSVQRQVVKGLAALLEDATGECPRRSYVSSERSRDDVGEHGWFHKLCERFAQFVLEHEMIPPEMRAARPPSLEGLVNQELKLLRQEVEARAG